MIPIRDDTPRTTTPYVTYFLIALNSLVFVVIYFAVPVRIFHAFAFIPAKIPAFLNGVPAIRDVDGHTYVVNLVTTFVPVFTSMFLHAGWLHLIFNMWGLWIFGDNVEDHLGHFAYLLFYLVCGLAAASLQFVFDPSSTVPNVGASGAIAGIMGAYFLLFPSARVLTLVPFFFLYFTWLPAWLILGYWFVVQFLSGAARSITYAHTQGGGVAFWAHVGGFVAGLALIKVFPARAPRYRYTEWS